MSRRLRIAYVIPSARVGGSEFQLLHLMRGLATECELTLICTRTEGTLIGDFRRTGADVHILDAVSGWDYRVLKRMRRIFRGRRPHIVQTCLFGFDWFANRAAREARVPVVISTRRELPTWQKTRHRMMQRLANRQVDCIVANSKAVADYAVKHEHAPGTLYRVIPNGVNADEFVSAVTPEEARARFRLPQTGYVVGMVANFSPVKDHPLFMDMAAELLRRRDDINFVLLGGGPLVGAMGRLIERRKQAKYFTRFSTVSELADLYAALDVSVLCSKMEGFPNAVIESMASGTPVVASAVGGIPELVQDGVTGRLIQSRSPRDFAEAVDGLLNDASRREAMGRAGAAWVRQHLPMERMVDQYRNLYWELLDHKKSATE